MACGELVVAEQRRRATSLAGVRPASARIVWYSSLSISATAFLARSWFADFAATAMFGAAEQHRRGAPSVPGRAKTPTFFIMSGQPVVGVVDQAA